MKKKIFIFILGSLIFFSFPKIALAGCNNLGGAANCSRGQIRCNGNDGQIYCCSQVLDANGNQTACNQVPGGATQTTSSTFTTAASTGQAAVDIHGKCGANGISTAIGCLDVLGGQQAFIGQLLRWAVGVGGGIAFLLIVYAGFMIMTAAGNPDRLKAGQELLTSAISGLILLIFSLFILNFIGFNILGIFPK